MGSGPGRFEPKAVLFTDWNRILDANSMLISQPVVALLKIDRSGRTFPAKTP